jgi:aspartyl-tRNA(Asn)/glutamyl-tRNA(Gln) amidotransferase subunit A
MSVAELIESYRRRERSPVEVARDALDRIARLQPRVNAFVTGTGGLAWAGGGRRGVRRWDSGALAGVPVTIKGPLM